MPFIDTHCHLNMLISEDEKKQEIKNYNMNKVSEYIERAVANHVSLLLTVGTDLQESTAATIIAHNFKSNVRAAIGIHPNDVHQNWQEDLKKLFQLFNVYKEDIKAIGECGLDFHYPGYDKAVQIQLFRAQIEMALSFNLPLIIHSRDAARETMDVLNSYSGSKGLRGIIHCFSYDQLWAEEIVANSFLLGIGGTVTYPKNNHIRKAVEMIGIDKIVLETDAPFLPIQSMRGKENHSRYLPKIAEYIAYLKGESLKKIEEETTANARLILDC